jgi:hypothetical protein
MKNIMLYGFYVMTVAVLVLHYLATFKKEKEHQRKMWRERRERREKFYRDRELYELQRPMRRPLVEPLSEQPGSRANHVQGRMEVIQPKSITTEKPSHHGGSFG